MISRDGKMPRGGVDHHAIYLKDGRPLAWRLGMTGKWLIDASGTLHVWRTIDKCPHHADAAERLGVSVWLLDGIVHPDGTLEPTAKAPGVDPALLISGTLSQAEYVSRGLKPHRRQTDLSLHRHELRPVLLLDIDGVIALLGRDHREPTFEVVVAGYP